MEVIWIRLFTAYIGPVVYSFARILAAYLGATFRFAGVSSLESTIDARTR